MLFVTVTPVHVSALLPAITALHAGGSLLPQVHMFGMPIERAAPLSPHPASWVPNPPRTPSQRRRMDGSGGGRGVWESGIIQSWFGLGVLRTGVAQVCVRSQNSEHPCHSRWTWHLCHACWEQLVAGVRGGRGVCLQERDTAVPANTL